MKMKLIICSIVLGLMSQLEAYTVKNQLPAKKVTLSQFVYHYGSSSVPQNSTVVLNPGQNWADAASCDANSASFTATIGTKTFTINNLVCDSAVVFKVGADGQVTYTVS